MHSLSHNRLLFCIPLILLSNLGTLRAGRSQSGVNASSGNRPISQLIVSVCDSAICVVAPNGDVILLRPSNRLTRVAIHRTDICQVQVERVDVSAFFIMLFNWSKLFTCTESASANFHF